MSCLTEEKTEANTAEMQPLDLPEGVPPLQSLYMYIAGSCNLACRHCWIEPDFSPDRSKGKFLKLEWAKKAVVEAKTLGLQSVKLTGGEPLFYPQFREIVQLIAQERIYITIETNGTLVDDDLAAFLRDAGRVRFISVSVDGAKAKTHENLRGVAGSFDKAVAGIRSLVKVGFRPQLICTLHKGNVDEIEEVIALAERLGCGSVKFNHVQRIGRGEQMLEEEKGLGIEELIALNDDLEKSIPGRTKIRTFFDVPYAFMSIRRIQANIGVRCKVLNILAILPEGELSLCGIGTTFHELIYGHISLENLRSVWLYSPGLRELRDKIPSRIEGICKECLFREYCMGQCIANNFRNGRKINAPFFFCQQAHEIGKFPRSRVKGNRS